MLASIHQSLILAGVPAHVIQRTIRDLANTDLRLAERFLVVGGGRAFFADAANYADNSGVFIVDTEPLR